MNIRKYRSGEENALWLIYYNTTHQINGKDYTADQCEEWAPSRYNMEVWKQRVKEKNPYVAEVNGEILGFAELEPSGYIDYFYCHHEHQRKGVGRALYEKIEKDAVCAGIKCLHAAVSVTACDFFLRMGFEITKKQQNIVCGTVAPNFIMRKPLPAYQHGS